LWQALFAGAFTSGSWRGLKYGLGFAARMPLSWSKMNVAASGTSLPIRMLMVAGIPVKDPARPLK